MPIRSCPECGREISYEALSCPGCGASTKASQSLPGNVVETKKRFSSVDIVALGCGVASIFMPYFAAVVFVPCAFVASIIAYRKGDKRIGTLSFIMAIFGLLRIFGVSDEIFKPQ